MNRFLPRLAVCALLLGLSGLPSGCSLYQAYVQRHAIEQAQFSLESVALGGVTLGGVNLELTLELTNPTDTPIILDRLDYTLFVNDVRAVEGFSSQKLTVPPHDVRPVTFHTFVRFADIGAQLNAMRQRGVASYRLEGVGHFDTPFGTIDYPVKLLGSS